MQISLGLIPFLSLGYIGHARHQGVLKELSVVQAGIIKAKKISFLEKDKERFLEKYKKANHFYVEEVLETLPLLKEEGKILQAMNQEELFHLGGLVKRREEKLSANKMKFAENKRSEGNGLIETEGALLNKVEVDGEDLKEILSLIEGVYVGSFAPREEAPQLIIKRFSLENKKGTALLDLEIIKREIHEKI